MTLKEVLGDELFAQVEAKINEINAKQTDKAKHVRFADLSEGGYVSLTKYNDKVNSLTQQVTDLQGQITQRDTDLKGLNDQLVAAQADAGQLAEAQKQLSSLQSKYDKDLKAWEAKNTQQAYEYAIRTAVGGLKFSSAAAKRDFERGAIEKGLKMEGDKILGFDDYVSAYKQADPGAFATQEVPAAGAPQIVLPSGKSSSKNGANGFDFHFTGVRPAPKE